MKRRDFIKTTALSSACLALPTLPVFSQTSKKAKHITILHTNDTHSQIEPFEATHAKYPGKAGVAPRATIIEQIRRENPNTLLLDAGDMFQGTPYFNYYGGEIELKLMSKLKYDASTLGNHEFDNGLSGLLAPMAHANFDIINSNYDFSNTILEGHIKKYKIFEVDGVKIGVFGLGVQLEGLVNPSNFGETKYLDPVEIATDYARMLKHEKNCDLVVCLSHLGFKYTTDQISDVILAQKTRDIDLIIGGHTHTFLEKPVQLNNLDGIPVIVNQTGAFGVNLGRIDFYLEPSQITTTGRSIEIY